jgi:hypothetical protein
MAWDSPARAAGKGHLAAVTPSTDAVLSIRQTFMHLACHTGGTPNPDPVAIGVENRHRRMMIYL